MVITLESKNDNIFPKYRFAVVRGFKNLKVVCPFIRTLIVISDVSEKAAFNKTKCFEKVHLGGNYQIYQ